METTQSIFLRALKSNLYHEAAHLYLARWQKLHKAQSVEEKIYKGLLHGATALDLIEKGKYKTAKAVWKIYEKYRPLIKEGVQHYQTLHEADQILMGYKQKYKEVLGS